MASPITPRPSRPSNANTATTITSTAFSDLTKRRVTTLLGPNCWICGASPVQVCHVIAQAEKPLFSQYVNRNLVAFDSLRDPSNAVPLCGTCHDNYDCSNAGVIFIPSDLEFFLRWEQQDRSRRVALKEADGMEHARVCVTENDYLEHLRLTAGNFEEEELRYATYDIYITRDYFPKRPPRRAYAPGLWATGVQWHGSPTAAILKSLGILKSPIGIPVEIVGKLAMLSALWWSEVETPAARAEELSANQEGSDGTGGGGGAGGSGGSRHTSRQSSANTPHKPYGAFGIRKVQPSPGQRGSDAQPGPSESFTHPDDDYESSSHILCVTTSSGTSSESSGYTSGWRVKRATNTNTWGPNIPTQTVVDFYCKALGAPAG